MTYCNVKVSFGGLFLLLIILNYFDLNAQEKEIFTQKDDSLKVQQLLDLGYQYEFVDMDSALIIYELAGNISRKIDYTIGIGKSLNYQGILQFEKGNYSAAEQFYLQSIKEFEKINYMRGIAANYNNLGNIYLYYNDLDRCINQYLNSVTIFESIKDTVSIINAYNNIGTIFYNNNQYQKSLEYLEKARQLSLSTPDSSFIVYTYHNMSNSYNKLHDTINGNKYLQEALKLINPDKDLYISIMVYNSYSDFLKQNNKIGEAIEYAKMSLELAQKSQNPINICYALIHLGEKSMLNKQYSQSEEYLKQAKQIAVQNGLQDFLALAHTNLAQLYQQTNDYENAYFEITNAFSIRDTIKTKERQQIINELETKYQLTKKEQLIAEKDLKITNQQKTIIWIIITVSGVIFTLILGIAYIQLRRKILANQLQNIEKEKEIQNMKFLIQGEEKERLRMARELHDGVNGSLGAIKLLASAEARKNEDKNGKWKNIFSMIDQVSNEVREISHNLMPDVIIRLGLQEAVQGYIQKLQNGSIDFDVQFYGNVEMIDDSIKITIYRIIQELSRNIINHSEASECIIQLNKHENSISLSVEDDGKGFETSEFKETKNISGIGLHSIYSRIELLGGKMDIQSDKNSGTSFQIELPINSNL